MANILYFNSKNSKRLKENFFKGLWEIFSDQDIFTKTSIIAMGIIVIVTPIIVTSQIILSHYASQTTNYLAQKGTGTVFSISNITPEDINIYNATITWTTLSPTKSKIMYWEDNIFFNILSNFWTLSVSDNNYVTSHSTSLPIRTLKSNSDYKYKLNVTDADGEEFVSPTYSFRTVGY